MNILQLCGDIARVALMHSLLKHAKDPEAEGYFTKTELLRLVLRSVRPFLAPPMKNLKTSIRTSNFARKSMVTMSDLQSSMIIRSRLIRVKRPKFEPQTALKTAPLCSTLNFDWTKLRRKFG